MEMHAAYLEANRQSDMDQERRLLRVIFAELNVGVMSRWAFNHSIRRTTSPQATCQVTADQIQREISLLEGHQVEGYRFNFETFAWEVVISHPRIKPVIVGNVIPAATLDQIYDAIGTIGDYLCEPSEKKSNFIVRCVRDPNEDAILDKVNSDTRPVNYVWGEANPHEEKLEKILADATLRHQKEMDALQWAAAKDKMKVEKPEAGDNPRIIMFGTI